MRAPPHEASRAFVGQEALRVSKARSVLSAKRALADHAVNPATRIVSWRLAPDEFLAFPIAETGKELPPLNLMPFFTEYNSATEASEVELASEQVGLQRARVELETARVNAGLPAR